MSRQDRPAAPAARGSAPHGHGAPLAVQQPSSPSQTDCHSPWQPTQPSKQTFFSSKNAGGVRSAPAGLKNQNRSKWPAIPRKNHSPAHHPNTNKLTTTEQKQSQGKVDKTDKRAEKLRAATTAATQSGAYDITT